MERATYAIDFPCRTKRGRDIECLVSLARTSGFEENKNVVVMYEDITERKKAEKALESSENNYRSIFDSVSDAIMVHEVDSTKFVDTNASANKIFGYTNEEFSKMVVGDICDGSDKYNDATALAVIKQAARSDKEVVVDWRFKDKSGKLFWGEVRLKTAIIAGQKRVLANINDISERIKVEKEIQKRNSELERFNKLVVGREEKMMELKRQIKELQSKLDNQN
jgi:PAS domain S-box-containing protein